MVLQAGWQQRWPADLLVLFAGACMPLAYAPLGWWPVALVALVLLFHFIAPVSTRRASWRGYLFGLGWFATGISWVFVSIRLFGNANTPLSLTITALLVLVLACYPLLAVWLIKQLSVAHKGKHVLWVVLVPAVWVVVEWLRAWLFTGFAWLEPGYAFIDTPLAVLAPIGGVLTVTFAVVLSATLLALLFQRDVGKPSRILSAAVLCGVWITTWWIGLPAVPPLGADRLQVALVQGNIPQHRKWLPQERAPTLSMYRRLTEQHWDKDLIIWPETAIPAFEDQVSDYMETMHAAAQLSSTTLMTGIVVRESHGDRYYNALVTLGNADRGAQTIYTKQHLVPFGEYLPFKFLLDPILGFLEIPMSDFSAGDANKPLVEAGRYQAGVSICFEDAFSAEVRGALPEADYLVNISNDAWFGDSLAPHQHLQMARMRALETGRYLLRSTNTGISAIIAPNGRIQVRSAQFQREVLTGTIASLSTQTFFTRWGHYPALLISLIIILVIRLKPKRE